MKEYNMKAIVDKDELKLIFECDKEKNKQCKGYENCRECNHTTDSNYMKAKSRQHNKHITDKEIIINLEDEIDYYRHEINLLKKVHEENRDCINQQDELIKEYQEILRKVIFEKEDILNTRTPNQIRKLLGYNEVNKETLNKRFEITINSEKYIIIYNSNIEANTIELNAYLTKLINERDKIMICKDNKFKIINETRKRNHEMYLENFNKEAEEILKW